MSEQLPTIVVKEYSLRHAMLLLTPNSEPMTDKVVATICKRTVCQLPAPLPTA